MKSFFALLLASASVYAAAPNVGLLDEQEVFKKYAKAVDLQAEIRKSEESAQASVGERVKVVEQLQAELVAVQKRGQDPMLSENGKKAVDAELQQKNVTFQQRRAELQNFVNEARGAIQQRVGEMNKQILSDARVQAEKVAKAKGLQLVLGKSQAFFSDASLDITEEVLKEMNAAYKAAAPAVAPAPAAPAPAAPAAPAPAAGDKPAAK
ncbi:MAG: OmpH family outer membrane protein [Opitutales bacterium]